MTRSTDGGSFSGRGKDCAALTVAGRSFTCSDATGDITGRGLHGYFHNDTRYLSQLLLAVGGISLDAAGTEHLGPADVVFDLVVGDGSGPIVTRARRQGVGLEETITIRNGDHEPWQGEVTLAVDADFAHVLDVRLGDRDSTRVVSVIPTGTGVVFETDRPPQSTTVVVDPPGPFTDGLFRWVVEVAPAAEWRVTVLVSLVAEGELVDVPVDRGGSLWPLLTTTVAPLAAMWSRSQVDLDLLTIDVDGHACYAAGAPWFLTLFGRDAAITALETLAVDQGLALSTAEALASLRGTVTVAARSEEPGKILHELREGDRALEEGRCYYGSVDATPLFCVLLGALAEWGADPARLRALLPAMRDAVGWLHHRLEVGRGLLTYGSGGTRLRNEGWKDSAGSIVDVEGYQLEPPIALVEVQGYAAAAFEAAAGLERMWGDPEAAGGLLEDASRLRDRLEADFWRPHLGTYAMALGEGSGSADVVSTNPAHLLWLGIVPRKRARAVAETLVGPELWTGYGVRCLGRSNPAYDPASYHRGSVWPHDTALAAAGLARYGLAPEARLLIGGLLAAAPHFGHRLPEVFSGVDRTDAGPVPLAISSSPQAWSAGVAPLIATTLLGLRPGAPGAAVTVKPMLGDVETLELSGVRVRGTSLSVEARGHVVVAWDASDLTLR